MSLKFPVSMMRAGAVDYANAVLADSPTAYWRLGESSGTVASDELATNDGTYLNTPTLGVAGAVAGDTAITLNGASQFYNVPSISAFSFIQNTAIFTIEFWIKFTNPAIRKAVMSNTIYASQKGFFIVLENGVNFGTKALRVALLNGSGTVGVDFRTADNAITDSNWHHVVITHTAAANNSSAIYIDGVSQSITTTTFNTVSTGDSTYPLYVGAGNKNGSPWNPVVGSMDEVAIYPTALAEARILAHYNAGA